MTNHPPDSPEPNSVEVEFSQESWKTEFHDEIREIRLNGEKIAEIHDLVRAMKSMKEANDRAIKGLSIAIVVLCLLGLGTLGYGVSYLSRFKVNKLDDLIEAGIDRFDMTNHSYIPLEIIAKLGQLSGTHPIVWDKKHETWFVIKPNRAKRPLANYIIFPKKAFKELSDFGFRWKDSKWTLPHNFPVLTQTP